MGLVKMGTTVQNFFNLKLKIDCTRTGGDLDERKEISERLDVDSNEVINE